ncbi:MAG TPA: FAD-dependent oxidoreductase, partial [Pseudobdellovibrionaceae bacterium]|nr:FAD-dependent oxidoreductase [Pseudobdellovibrionaceae bacterium]
MKRHDVVIIGAGSAGLAAREEVAAATDRYLVIDPGPLGTTCARAGCMPSKALVEVANAHHASVKLREIGVLTESEPIDRAQVMTHVRALRDRFVGGVLESQKEWETEHLLNARAKILSENLIEANGERIHADKIIVAAGTRPIVPEAWKNSGARLETTDSFFELKDLPDQIAVIGFGPVGLELSLALARLGVEVTVFGDAKNFGGLSDPEVIKAAKSALATELTLVEGRVESVRGAGDKTELRVNDETHSTKMILLAMGRESRFQELGLDRLPLKLDERGQPEIDPENFRLPGTEVYLVGDLNRKKPLLHEAVDQGRIAA